MTVSRPRPCCGGPRCAPAPLDSPKPVRITPRPPARSKAPLLPWTVPVVTLDAAAALTALSERVPGIRYGASLGYLADGAADQLPPVNLTGRGQGLTERLYRAYTTFGPAI